MGYGCEESAGMICSADGCERPHLAKGLCGACYQRAYRQANPEKARARQRAWRQANLEKARASERAYRQANPEKMLARQRAYRQANPEKMLARQRAYRKAHSEENCASEQKRRALKAGAFNDGSWLPIAEVAARQHGKCAGCALKFGPSLKPTHDHIDPLDNGGPHSAQNQQALCGPCNSAKGARLQSAQLAMV